MFSPREVSDGQKRFVKGVVLCGLTNMYPDEGKPMLNAISRAAEKLSHKRAKTTVLTDPDIGRVIIDITGDEEKAKIDLAKLDNLVTGAVIWMVASGCDAIDGSFSPESGFNMYRNEKNLDEKLDSLPIKPVKAKKKK